ncbi:MAG: hypothetical protein AAFY24_03315, partial [Pseudomonadota bacterium]
IRQAALPAEFSQKPQGGTHEFLFQGADCRRSDCNQRLGKEIHVFLPRRPVTDRKIDEACWDAVFKLAKRHMTVKSSFAINIYRF